MDLAVLFEQYAKDFDRTVEDDDWSRIRPYFTDDAVREEHMLPLMSFRHSGIGEIIDQWRQIVANFDRRFDRRVLVRVSPARQEADVVTLHWVGIYCVGDAPALLGEGVEVLDSIEGDRRHSAKKHPVGREVRRPSARTLGVGSDLGPGRVNSEV